MGTRMHTAPFRIHNGIPGTEMLYAMGTPSTPSAEVNHALMGFCTGDTAALGLPDLQ